jgi:hypothetical protein
MTWIYFIGDENEAFAFQEFVDRFTNELELGKPYFFKNVEFEMAWFIQYARWIFNIAYFLICST